MVLFAWQFISCMVGCIVGRNLMRNVIRNVISVSFKTVSVKYMLRALTNWQFRHAALISMIKRKNLSNFSSFYQFITTFHKIPRFTRNKWLLCVRSSVTLITLSNDNRLRHHFACTGQNLTNPPQCHGQVIPTVDDSAPPPEGICFHKSSLFVLNDTQESSDESNHQ